MIIKIPRKIQFLLSFAFFLLLYWPAINGTPIWDDYTNWFQDTNMQPHMSYFSILRYFGWPISVSVQKFLFGIINKNYFIYHLISLILHFINSVLLYRLARMMQFKYPFIYFLLFLLHPSTVITTAWMIQIKTLLCFLFAIFAVIFFLKGEKQLNWMILSWIFFFLSVGSKSASLALPAILLIIHFRIYKFKKIYLIIPFFIISSWGAFNILKSPITKEGSKRANVVTKNIENEQNKKDKDENKVSDNNRNQEKPNKDQARPADDKSDITKIQAALISQFSLEYVEKNKREDTNKLFQIDLKKMSQYLHYYFWQSFLPMRNEPVKGLNYESAGRDEVIHFLFLVCLAFIFIKDSAFFYLAAAHIMLLPFLGLIPAPYMSVTWVSDQHLYMSLPFLLAFWMRVIEKMKFKYTAVIPVCFILFYSIKTSEATSFYKDQFTFYEKCLDYNSSNVPIAYNLAFARAINGDLIASQNVLNNTIDQSQTTPQMKKSIYYPHLVNLYFMVNRALEHK